MTKALHIVILAAGEGKRMKSALPKVLQKIAGKPMIAHVVDAARIGTGGLAYGLWPWWFASARSVL